jgi:hypothetical protein
MFSVSRVIRLVFATLLALVLNSSLQLIAPPTSYAHGQGETIDRYLSEPGERRCQCGW